MEYEATAFSCPKTARTFTENACLMVLVVHRCKMDRRGWEFTAPGRFVVNRSIRPRKACRACEAIVQSPLPSRPIERGRPGPGLLAHVLVSKYADHLPLYRQSQIYAREGIDLDRSTMAD